jgi:hypothetical protein
VAQASFTAGWLVPGTWQGAHYSVVTNTISDMQAATAFAVGGVGTFCFALFGLRPALAAAGRVASWAPWTLAFAGLAIGNSFPLIPCQISDRACSAHRQLYSPGGLTDAIVATAAFFALAFLPGPLWKRLKLLPEWRRLRPVMITARIICPLCFWALCAASLTKTAEGLVERVLAACCALWLASVAAATVRIPASSAGERNTAAMR